MRLSCQLYTLREPLHVDPIGTIEKLGETGIKYIETAGFNGFTSEKFKSILDRFGLKVSASHVGLSELEENTDRVLDDAQNIETESIVIPWLDEKDRNDFGALAERLKPISHAVREAGMGFAYHNHDFEFKDYGGKLGIDQLYDSLPDLQAQLDLGWIHYAGFEPSIYIEKLEGRLDSVHLKDSRRGHQKMDLAAGEGELDFAKLIFLSESAGAKYGTIEVDEPSGDPLEVVAKCVKYFNALGLK